MVLGGKSLWTDLGETEFMEQTLALPYTKGYAIGFVNIIG